MPDELRDPALALSLLVGAFHTCIYLVLRGRIGLRTLAILVAAAIGAFAGQAIGGRVGDLLRLGDYGLLWASAFAWFGIAIVVITGAKTGGRKADDPGGEILPRGGDDERP